MGLIKVAVTRVIVVSIGLFWATVVIIRLAIRTIMNPSAEKFWHIKERTTPPACLTDPDLGTHKYVQLKEVKIHYVEKGDDSKPLMLFVHGFPDFWYSWRYQLKEFSKDYWTVALDMRGYGDSDKPSGIGRYRMDYLVNDLKEFIEALGRKQCILVAHDWGGAVAWQFVHKYPEMLEKYIIMDAPHPKGFRKLMLTSRKQFFMSWYIFMFQLPYIPEIFMRSYDMRGIKMMLKNKNSKSKATVGEEDVEAYKYTFGKPGAYTEPINYYRANFGGRGVAANGVEKNEELPGLMISGEKDDFLSLELLDLAKESVPNLKIQIIEGANHFVQQDDPESVNKVMRNFLQD